MKGFLVGIIVASTLFLGSCMDLKTSKQLESIEAMNTTLDSLETVFEEHALDLDSIGKISLNAYGVENRIKKNYHSDTINVEFGRKMDAFKIMRINLKPMGKTQLSVPASIEEERTKLKELQTDIENGNGKREKYDEYVAFEQNKVNDLRTLVTEYVQVKEASLKTYNELFEELNAFSMSLLENK